MLPGGQFRAAGVNLPEAEQDNLATRVGNGAAGLSKCALTGKVDGEPDGALSTTQTNCLTGLTATEPAHSS